MRGPIRLTLLVALAATASLALPRPAQAQIFDKLKDATVGAAEDEVVNQVDRMVRSGVGCVFNDLECIASAEESGDDVYLTDAEGEAVVDEDGDTVSDPGQAAEILGEDPPPAPGPAPGVLPGQGATVNVDFVPGERTIVSADYSDDNLGDFPRRFELLRGSFDVVEWEGDRYVRALATGVLAIPLPETLPENFTLETAISIQHGNGWVIITPGRAYNTRRGDYRGSGIQVAFANAGVVAVHDGPRAMTGHSADVVRTQVAPVKVMADGEHMKVYLDDRRVANVPNAIFPRSDTLFVAVSSAYEEKPILIGPIRIAAGEVDLYDRLARDGRVTTRGILFDVSSDAIRPESAPALEEIGTMLHEHPDLRLSIEGHTDSDGQEAFNRELSARRAASVKQHLVDTYAIDRSRLETAGFGESKPVAPNDTTEGKQQNRRVELVRL